MASVVETYLHRIQSACTPIDAGTLADYIPQLAAVDPDRFGVSVVVHDGHVYSVGDSAIEFTIQSISKALTYALALRERGFDDVDAQIGVEPSGEAFNEISVDHRTRRPRNPMINAGAITATALLLKRPGVDAATPHDLGTAVDEAFEVILEFYSGCAGRHLTMDDEVYRSEMATGSRNRAIAYMLESFGVFPSDPEAAVDLYVRQCSVKVTSDDLAAIGSTLANGGVNPRTGRRMLDTAVTRRVLSVMTTCGMYDGAGDWVTTVGLPAKSGVGGGILAVLPGQLGIGVYSPRLDEHGNSVRGVEACRHLSDDLGLHMFNVARESRVTIRSTYDGHELDLGAGRSEVERAYLRAHRHRVRVLELQGDLTFSGAESVVRRVESLRADADVILIDLTRVGVIDDVSRRFILGLRATLLADDTEWVIVDPDGVVDAAGRQSRRTTAADAPVSSMAEATERAEDILLKSAANRTA
ncbi:glutaminase [Williamsia sp. Leaf354]|uniref:glutaminase A n=1 Tax=Williamsia sp. Leaf354 TaxID=1736349 RepID=UPI0006FCF98D|nr:glutaminase A [Williamsia sp. Leaf354]KQR98954.1 glutaminase [Williamsia sp. Leaf354]